MIEKQRLRLMRTSKEELKAGIVRRRYLVPNAVTLGNLFCGFLAIIYATSDRPEKAIIAIGLAILLDGLDGRVARKLKATSKFGLEFDSFSDLVSFGVAPALLLYHWCFLPLADEFGVSMTFLLVMCAATRLARFNISDPNLKSFQGLPSPAAAGVVVAFVNFSPRVEPSWFLVVLGAFLATSVAFLMVSNFKFLSIKVLKIDSMHLFWWLALGMLISLIWYKSSVGFLVIAICYAASGPVLWWKGRRESPSVMAVDSAAVAPTVSEVSRS